jgi:sulfoxide reductase heme-binding subunit YedZ
MQPSNRQLSLLKVILFFAALLPLGRLALAAWQDDFGANPVEFIQRWTGTWTINFLMLSLCITPLRAITQWHWLIRLRRMLGLFAIFYGTLHFLAFIGFDHDFMIDAIARDILKRPFVTVGFAALALMLPLALTSNAYAIRKLGGRRWQELHRSTYLISILAVLHYFWLAKATALLWPLAYAVALAALLGWRIKERRRKAIPVPKPVTAKPLRFFKERPE